MAFAFVMLAFVFKFSIMRKMPHLKKLRSLVLMKEVVGFFQLSLLLLVQYLAKTKIIPHLGECSHVSLIFRTKLRTHMRYFQRAMYFKTQRWLFLDWLQPMRHQEGWSHPVPHLPTPVPMNSLFPLCWHQCSCSDGVTRPGS